MEVGFEGVMHGYSTSEAALMKKRRELVVLLLSITV